VQNSNAVAWLNFTNDWLKQTPRQGQFNSVHTNVMTGWVYFITLSLNHFYAEHGFTCR
jgi:hypothetical protein